MRALGLTHPTGQPCRSLLELRQVAVETKPKKGFTAVAECCTRGQADVSFIDNLERRLARVRYTVHREKEVEGALWSADASTTFRPEYSADKVPRLSRALDLRNKKAVAVIQRGDTATLHELGDARRRILDQVLKELLQ